jgi:hypothetical protein
VLTIADHFAASCGPNADQDLRSKRVLTDLLDVNGDRLIIDAAYFTETSSADRAELERIIDSLEIEIQLSPLEAAPTWPAHSLENQ